MSTQADITAALDNLGANQRKFVLAYTSGEHEGNGTKAYQQAYGCSYNCARNEAAKNLAKPCIDAAIKAIQSREDEKAVDARQKVLDSLDRAEALAWEKGNLNALARIIELKGKHLAMFTDRLITQDDAKTEEIKETERQELEELARLRLQEQFKIRTG